MAFVAIVLLVAIVIALLRGGKLSNLTEIRLRAWLLLFLGFAMQASTLFLPRDTSWSSDVAVVLVLTSFLPLIAVAFLNRTEPGMWLAAIGILMNFSVILANGGMPVSPEAAALAGGDGADLSFEQAYKHVELDGDSQLTFLADVIPLRVIRQVISLGDVFLAVGLGQFLEAQLRKPVRYFKYGVPSKGGSATP